jgi:hypothetical protein
MTLTSLEPSKGEEKASRIAYTGPSVLPHFQVNESER